MEGIVKFYYSLIPPRLNDLRMEQFSSEREEAFGAFGINGSDIVLDLGIGSGTNVPFYAHAKQAYGVDFSQRCLMSVRGAVRLSAMHASRLGFRDASFDKLVLTWTASCIDDQAGLFREAARVLKPGGRMLLLDFFPVLCSGPMNILGDARGLWCKILGNNQVFRDVPSDISHTGLSIVEEHEFSDRLVYEGKRLRYYIIEKSL